AIVSRNVPEYIEAMFGCWWAGLVAVPVNAKLHPRELAFILEDSGARFAFVDAAWQSAIGNATDRTAALERVVELGSAEYAALCLAQPRNQPATGIAADPAWLFYTSGTTGRPKGVVITHGNLRAMSECFLAGVERVATGEALLHPAPLSHGSGLYVLPHVFGGAINVVPESGGFDPTEIVALIEVYDRSSFFAAPTMVKRLVDSPPRPGARVGDPIMSVFH